MKLARLLSATLCGSAVLLGTVGISATANAEPAPANAGLTLTYDDSRTSPENQALLAEAATIWNGTVDNLNLLKSTTRPDVVILDDENDLEEILPEHIQDVVGIKKLGEAATLRTAMQTFGAALGLRETYLGPTRCANVMNFDAACTGTRVSAQEITEVTINIALGKDRFPFPRGPFPGGPFPGGPFPGGPFPGGPFPGGPGGFPVETCCGGFAPVN